MKTQPRKQNQTATSAFLTPLHPPPLNFINFEPLAHWTPHRGHKTKQQNQGATRRKANNKVSQEDEVEWGGYQTLNPTTGSRVPCTTHKTPYSQNNPCRLMTVIENTHPHTQTVEQNCQHQKIRKRKKEKIVSFLFVICKLSLHINTNTFSFVFRQLLSLKSAKLLRQICPKWKILL